MAKRTSHIGAICAAWLPSGNVKACYAAVPMTAAGPTPTAETAADTTTPEPTPLTTTRTDGYTDDDAPEMISSIVSEGDPSMDDCYESWSQYNSYELYSSGEIPEVRTTKNIPYVSKAYFLNTSVPTSTFCDGVPRVFGTSNVTVDVTILGSAVPTSFLSAREYVAKPSCTIPAEQLQIYGKLQMYVEPIKMGPSDTPCPEPTGIQNCFVVGDLGTMVFYWPESTTGECGKMTAVPGTQTIPGQPNTAVYEGFTVTSPDALVAMYNARTAVVSTFWTDSADELPQSPPGGSSAPPLTHSEVCGQKDILLFTAAQDEFWTLSRWEVDYVLGPRGYLIPPVVTSTIPFSFWHLNPGAMPTDAYQ